MNLNLKNKNALVCGSTQGIGKAIALSLAAEGANVTLLARNENKLKKVLSELPASGKHNYIVADFSEHNTLQENISAYLDSNPGFHILINNTGGPKAGSALNADIKEYQQAFSQHLICNQLLTQAVVPGMKSYEFGRIINIISTSVKQPLDGLGVSNTIRGAVANWSKTLSNELASFGITLIIYCPVQRLPSA